MENSITTVRKLHNILVKPTRKKVAAYARVSVDEEVNLKSLAHQISYYTDLISTNKNWEFSGVFYDEGISGTSTKNRQGFITLLEKCDNHEVDLIITKSISRFARNTLDLLEIVRHLKEINIDVYFEKENIHSLSNDGELMLTLLASFAQEESRSISENTKWGIRKRFEKGIGNNFILYGYRWKDKKWVIEEAEALNVKNIFSLYLQGKSPTFLSQSFDIPYSTLWQMLRNEMYTGDVTLQKVYIENHLTHHRVVNNGELPMYRVTDYLPQIISKETYSEVQDEIQRRAQLGWKCNSNTPFSCFTQLLVCRHCGEHYLKRQKSCSRENTETKSTYHYWRCKGRIRHSDCENRNVPHSTLVELTAEILGTNENLEDLVNTEIEKIVVDNFTLTYVMKDGSEITKEWSYKRKNNVYARS